MEAFDLYSPEIDADPDLFHRAFQRRLPAIDHQFHGQPNSPTPGRAAWRVWQIRPSRRSACRARLQRCVHVLDAVALLRMSDVKYTDDCNGEASRRA